MINVIFKKVAYGLLVVTCAYTVSLSALTFALPSNGDSVVGGIQEIRTRAGDNFSRVGRRYDVGYYQMVEANPGIEPDAILPEDTRLVIPTRFVLPNAPRKGIVINLAELRLYYYSPDGRTVSTHPIGIGREGYDWKTPLATTHIYAKVKDPTWYVPQNIREARAEEGIDLPKIVPPGPDNPMGGYQFRLAIKSGSYLIHGTNDASGVGRRSSAGCIRMLPEDIESLYEYVPVNTAVQIINQPYKVGRLEDQLYLETHLPLQEQMQQYGNNMTPMVQLVSAAVRKYGAEVDWDKAERVTMAQKGYPIAIGTIMGTPVREKFSQATKNKKRASRG